MADLPVFIIPAGVLTDSDRYKDASTALRALGDFEPGKYTVCRVIREDVEVATPEPAKRNKVKGGRGFIHRASKPKAPPES
jgi:hypothetical protein